MPASVSGAARRAVAELIMYIRGVSYTQHHIETQIAKVCILARYSIARSRPVNGRRSALTAATAVNRLTGMGRPHAELYTDVAYHTHSILSKLRLQRCESSLFRYSAFPIFRFPLFPDSAIPRFRNSPLDPPVNLQAACFYGSFQGPILRT